VSLILDALRKLERDKESREPNVLVVGSVPWGTRARSRLPLVAAVAAMGLVALVAFVLWPRGRPASTATPPGLTSPPLPGPATAPSSAPQGAAPGLPGEAPPPERRSSVPGAEARPGEVPPSDAPSDLPETLPAPSRDASGPDDLRLNAISQRDGRPVALINDRLVFEGDGFDGVKVLRIGESEVEVEVRGVKRVLRF